MLILIISLCLISCNFMNKNKQEIPFKTSLLVKNDKVPIIQFRLSNDKVVNMLVDTGSELTIIDDNVYNNDSLIFSILCEKQMCYNTLNGSSDIYVKEVETTVNDSIMLGGYVFDIDYLIENTFINNGIMIDGVIGCDFLYKNGIVIDFENKVVKNIK